MRLLPFGLDNTGTRTFSAKLIAPSCASPLYSTTLLPLSNSWHYDDFTPRWCLYFNGHMDLMRSVRTPTVAAKTIMIYYIDILNHFNNRSTNASAESFNAKVTR